ncbi:hypothetical protein DRN74_02480 [Candidatus Micrarchaeota archaeon]|nr:MAG: hypothetical protein DRN74_02480 [Candidatus Micrarchaeota archaeon]
MAELTYVIPILTEKESEDDFLNKARKAEHIILLYVVDEAELKDVPSGFIGGRIKAAENVMDTYKKKFKRKNVEGFIEWGSWFTKIKAYYVLKKADLVLMRNSILANKIAKELKRDSINFEVV